MKTFNQLVTDYKTLSKDSSSSNEDLGKSRINSHIQKVLSIRAWDWNIGTATENTVENITTYPKPFNCGKLEGIRIKHSDCYYWPAEVKTRKEWVILTHNSINHSSDIPTHYFINEHNIEFYPTPDTSGDEITFYFQKITKNLGVANVTTGTVTATAGTVGITGANTSWTASMEGRSIEFGSDEGYWYEIDEVDSTTAIRLKRDVRVALSGSTFTIAEMIPLPYGKEDIPLWGALRDYYATQESSSGQNLYKLYSTNYEEDLGALDDMDKVSDIITDTDQINLYPDPNGINSVLS